MGTCWKLSDAASLAFHSMLFLSEQEKQRARTREIAEALSVSEHHLAKVHQRLSKANLIEAERGPQGGVQLTRPLEEITLLEIYETIEGRMGVPTCLLKDYTCQRSRCMFGSLLKDVNGQIYDYFAKTTLQSLMND